MDEKKQYTKKEHSRGNKAPRGYRLNNPLNIEHGTSKWLGLADEQPDPKFCKFGSRMYGWRAALIILKRTYRKRGWASPRLIIEHWAPTTENNTRRYLEFVCHWLGNISPDKLLAANDYLAMMKAMAIFENGYLDEDGLDEAWRNRRHYGCL